MLGFFSKKTTETAHAEDVNSPVKVLGVGCAKCDTLTQNTKEALVQLGSSLEVAHVKDYAEIASYGVMGTPALVYDRTVLCAGQVASTEQIGALLRPYLENTTD